MVNDKRSIIKVDLTSIQSDLNISLVNAKQKVGLMRIILNVDESVNLNDSNVYIHTLDKNYKLYDERWEYTIQIPLADLLDNKFMNDDNFESKVQNSITDDALILSTDISPDIIRGVQSNCELFNNNSVNFELEGDSADIKMSEQSKTNSGKIQSNISLNISDMPKSMFQLDSLPFRLDLNSSMQINVYKMKDDTCLCTCDLELDGSIPVSIYSRVKLLQLK
jgi:hypothetical protein